MKLRQVRFAARVHFLDACINAITFTDIKSWSMASCAMLFLSRLVRPAAATSLRTRSAGIRARHAHSIIEGETSETSEVVAHSSHDFLRRHASAPRARERA